MELKLGVLVAAGLAIINTLVGVLVIRTFCGSSESAVNDALQPETV